MARTRYQDAVRGLKLRELPAAALRAVLREGYARKDLRADVMAGLVVGVVALPLAMALAIAVGVPPQHGLATAVVAGSVVAILGGSRTQVTGPTAAFVVVLAPIYIRFGMAGLLLSGLFGGVILLVMGLGRLGQFIAFIPHPVTTGFTAGIAVVIGSLQLKEMFGLTLSTNPEHFFARLAALFEARATFSWAAVLVGATTLAILILFPRVTRRVPAPLVALPVAALLTALLKLLARDVTVATVASRFGGVLAGHAYRGVPPLPPLPLLPWHAAGAGGAPFVLSWETVRALLPGSFAVAMLGGIESLLSAVVADGMAGTRHDPDAELVALGVGNILAPFFGGIPATGAIARTATNIRNGGRSPVAAVVHALTVLVAMVALAPLIGRLPMAGLAALLLLVAWNISDVAHFLHVLRVAPRSDAVVLVACFALTVVFDMVVSVSVGVVLAALLFMRRMAEITHARLSDAPHPEGHDHPLPPGVVVYEITGPLFFGAAQRAMGSLAAMSETTRAVILRLDDVPVMDATGLVALESALSTLAHRRCAVVICGLRPQPAKVLQKAQILEIKDRLTFRPDWPTALQEASRLASQRASRTTQNALPAS